MLDGTQNAEQLADILQENDQYKENYERAQQALDYQIGKHTKDLERLAKAESKLKTLSQEYTEQINKIKLEDAL